MGSPQDQKQHSRPSQPVMTIGFPRVKTSDEAAQHGDGAVVQRRVMTKLLLQTATVLIIVIRLPAI